MKKVLLVCLLVLGMAGSAWAEENEYVHDMLVITTKDDNANVQEMRKILEKLQKTIEQPQVLGDAADKVNIQRMTSLYLCEDMVSSKEYPQMVAYKKDITSLYKELLTIKQSEDFFKNGVKSAQVKKWQAQRDKLEKMYNEADLPVFLNTGFGDLKGLLGDFSSVRLIPQKKAHDLSSYEETIFIQRKRIEAIIDVAIQD